MDCVKINKPSCKTMKAEVISHCEDWIDDDNGDNKDLAFEFWSLK